MWEAQYRLDLRCEFITEEQRPAATERPAWFFALRAPGPPLRIQRRQEIAVERVARMVAGDAVGRQLQRLAAGGEQQVPAPLRAGCRQAGGRGFEQDGITR